MGKKPVLMLLTRVVNSRLAIPVRYTLITIKVRLRLSDYLNIQQIHEGRMIMPWEFKNEFNMPDSVEKQALNNY